MNIKVTGLASARSVASPMFTPANGTVDPTAAPLSYPLDVVRSDGSYVTLQPSSGTLSEVVDAINEAEGFGIKAVAIRVGADASGNPSYRLQITSAGTGTENDFRLVPRGSGPVGTASDPQKLSGSGADGKFTPADYAALDEVADLTQLSAAGNATIQLGDGTDPISITSSTNTFADVMPGVSLTVSAETTTAATVTVGRDSNAVASAVQSLVDAANAALKDITLQSRAGSVGSDGKVTGGGTLRGDSTMRALKSQVLSAVTSAVGGTSAATFGLQSTRDGELTFDKTKFLEAYAKDPAGVQALVSTKATDPAAASKGVVERLREVTVGAIGDLKLSSAATGTLTSVIDGQNSSIKDLTSRIADWDTRLAAKKERYQKYYGALETALGKLQSQSTWLAGQLGSLPSGSSS
ncbi:flagellar filament capping protein FliD [Paenibacillus sp. TRM 82003]|nr:flagellar filament capping protein FliD [Paenibacillus sp. TRM 82003]